MRTRTFIFTATDTTARSICRLFDLLAQRPDVQEKLRSEVVEAFGGHSPTYQELMKLPMLDAVLKETLRLYPPVPFISREVKEDTVLGLSKPFRGTDGQMFHEIPLAKDTEIYLGILGSNTNIELWGDDAGEWKPERWLSPLPKTLEEAEIPGVYSHLMTFTGGQKSCIGFKFAEVTIKTSLATLLPTFNFGLTDKPTVWKQAQVSYPTMGADSTKPEMIVKMGLVQAGGSS